LFGLNIDKVNYKRPDTIPEVFTGVREWKPPMKKGIIHGSFTDSSAALSTDMEMEDNDAYGMRRAKEFSEELRKTCRIITEKNYLVVCSNQIRDVVGATQYQEKTKTPGGRGWEFYPSLRLRLSTLKKYKTTLEFGNKKEISKIMGVRTLVEVYKSSIWKPFNTAPITILFDYGIDDIRENLQFIKDFTKNTIYTCCGAPLDKSMEVSIAAVEDNKLEESLKEEVIELWEEIESKFKTERKPKR